MTMQCDQAELLLAAEALSALEPGELTPLREHLSGCAACREVAVQYRRAADLLPLTAEPVDPPAALRSRLMAQIHSEAAAARGSVVSGTRAAARLSRLWGRVPSGRRITAGAGLVTAVAVAAAIVALATRPASTPPAAETPLTVNACGLTAEPSACGTLVYHASTHDAVVSVRGLPSLIGTGGQAVASYEVWYIRANHSTVPAAFLSLAPGGAMYTAALTGDLSQYVAVAMTREPPGGAGVPTGVEVLRLDLPQTGATAAP